MNSKKSKLIFFITLAILVIVFIITIFLRNSTKPISQPANINTVDTMFSIHNTPVKIKITKFKENSIDIASPYICYISDTNQLKNFTDKINSLTFEYSKTQPDTSNQIYKIEFSSDNGNTTLTIFDNNMLTLENNSSTTAYSFSNTTFTELKNLLDIKYYLHSSALEKPNDEELKKAQGSLLSNLNENELSILRKNIHNIHSSLEFHLVNRIYTLKDANNIYWEVDSSSGVFIQPNGEKIQNYGFWEYRDQLKELNELTLNNKLHAILDSALNKIQNGIDNHDLSECFEAHKIVHDLDYWIVNYPISSFFAAPVDWGGLNCYYGLIENYNL